MRTSKDGLRILVLAGMGLAVGLAVTEDESDEACCQRRMRPRGSRL